MSRLARYLLHYKFHLRAYYEAFPIWAFSPPFSRLRSAQLILQVPNREVSCKSLCNQCVTAFARSWRAGQYITDLIPSEIFPRESIKIPPNIKLIQISICCDPSIYWSDLEQCYHCFPLDKSICHMRTLFTKNTSRLVASSILIGWSLVILLQNRRSVV